MTTLVYPPLLPVPSQAPIQSAERRILSPDGGPFETRAIQTDRLAKQQLTFPPFTQKQAAIFEDWWANALFNGGAWWLLTWPLPQGISTATCRFIGAPTWKAIAGGFWQVTADIEIRGRGVNPDDYVDPYWGNVVLHMNAENGLVYDASNYHWPLSIHSYYGHSSLPVLNTSNPKYGTACYDVTGGYISLPQSRPGLIPIFGADEMTAQVWIMLTAVPVGPNDPVISTVALFSFQPNGTPYGAIPAGNVIEGIASPFGPVNVGEWNHFALTRTNHHDIGAAYFDFFVNGKLAGTATTEALDSDLLLGSGFDIMGWGYPTNALIDDFQLTRGVNRYRGLTSFIPPEQLPTR